jgi:hypothetical protein
MTMCIKVVLTTPSIVRAFQWKAVIRASKAVIERNTTGFLRKLSGRAVKM